MKPGWEMQAGSRLCGLVGSRTGTVVQLSSGEIAEVIRGARGIGDRPAVRLISDAKGAALASPVEIDLGYDSVSAFSAMFRRAAGTSPSAYRHRA